MSVSDEERRDSAVSNRMWALLTSAGLIAVGLPGLLTLIRDGEWVWLQLLAVALGVGGFIDLVRRWNQM